MGSGWGCGGDVCLEISGAPGDAGGVGELRSKERGRVPSEYLAIREGR